MLLSDKVLFVDGALKALLLEGACYVKFSMSDDNLNPFRCYIDWAGDTPSGSGAGSTVRSALINALDDRAANRAEYEALKKLGPTPTPHGGANDGE